LQILSLRQSTHQKALQITIDAAKYGIVAELGRLRTEAGRAQRPFETVIGLSTPPDLATFQRLADAGMDIGMSYPFKYIVGERSSVDEKKRAMDQFAATIIRAFDRRA